MSLDIVAHSLLAVARGGLWAHESCRRSLAHETMEVWCLGTGNFVLRSWDLPAGAEVVGGGPMGIGGPLWDVFCWCGRFVGTADFGSNVEVFRVRGDTIVG